MRITANQIVSSAAAALSSDALTTPAKSTRSPTYPNPSLLHPRCAHIEPAPEAPGDVNALLTSLSGIGPSTAEAIVSVFGSSIDNIKEMLSQPEKQAIANLTRVPGIGKIRAANIKKSWDKTAGEWSRLCSMLL
jgi:ribosomal protein S13